MRLLVNNDQPIMKSALLFGGPGKLLALPRETGWASLYRLSIAFPEVTDGFFCGLAGVELIGAGATVSEIEEVV
jgi:hypothetical protein